MIHVVAVLTAKPGKREEILKHFRANVPAVRAEKGCIEYGSYWSEWRRRLALKMWTGWPTFPMVFVKGVLVGGAQDLERLINSGELKK